MAIIFGQGIRTGDDPIDHLRLIPRREIYVGLLPLFRLLGLRVPQFLMAFYIILPSLVWELLTRQLAPPELGAHGPC
jgi:hypothetical protein